MVEINNPLLESLVESFNTGYRDLYTAAMEGNGSILTLRYTDPINPSLAPWLSMFIEDDKIYITAKLVRVTAPASGPAAVMAKDIVDKAVKILYISRNRFHCGENRFGTIKVLNYVDLNPTTVERSLMLRGKISLRSVADITANPPVYTLTKAILDIFNREHDYIDDPLPEGIELSFRKGES